MICFEKFDFENYKNKFVVTDEKISELFGIRGDNVLIVPRGEKAKNFFYVQKICEWLLANGAQKADVAVAVGGGSIGDVVGFAASVFKRGIGLLHVPTTFLAQIDSSIGGKTAVDLGGVKNAVGTFYPADTLIDTDFLRTLPKKQWKNGQGELLKYRMLSSDVDSVAVSGDVCQTVKACVAFKTGVCERDPFDTGERHILNFGHTMGHALELSYRIPHGEAVANGIFYEVTLACRLGLTDKFYAKKWQDEAKKLFPIRALTPQILQLTLHDKKDVDGKVGFVLPSAAGFVSKQIQFDQLEQLLLR